MKRRTLLAKYTSLRGRKSGPFSSEFPLSRCHLVPGPLSLYCFLAQCPQLWSQKQPLPRRALLCCHGYLYSGFSSKEQELRCGVKEVSIAAAAWEGLFFLIPAPQKELTPGEPGLLEGSFVSYLMTQLLPIYCSTTKLSGHLGCSDAMR